MNIKAPRPQKSTVQLGIGGFGIRAAALTWDTLALQYGLCDCDDGLYQKTSWDKSCLTNIYEELSEGVLTPRCLFIDVDSEIADFVQRSHLKNYFSDHHYVVNLLESQRYVATKDIADENSVMLELTNERMRCHIENCEVFSGFVFVNAVEGKTGSRMSSAIIESMDKKLECIMHALWPSVQADSTVGTYNTMLCFNSVQSTGCQVLYNNQALQERAKIVTSNPTLRDMNDCVSIMVAASMHEVNQLQSYCVPFHSCNAVIPCRSPVPMRTGDDNHNAGNIQTEHFSPRRLTQNLNKHKCSLHSMEPANGKLMGGLLMYHVPEAMVNTIVCSDIMRNSFRFASWVKDISSVARPVIFMPQRSKFSTTLNSLSAFLNTTAVKNIYRECLRQYDVLDIFKSFQHWYQKDGYTHDDFDQARLDMHNSILNYEDLDLEVYKEED